MHKNSRSAPVKLTLLGTGTLRSDNEVACTSSLISAGSSKILVDCGPGCLMRLQTARVPVQKISHIFLTHFHPDHISDLTALLFAVYHAKTQQRKIRIYGPSGLLEIRKNLVLAFGDWLNAQCFHFHELSDNYLLENGFKVAWLRVRHNKESIGYRFSFDNHIISFSGDSGYCPELITLLEEADLALLECSYPDNLEDPHHLTPTRVARIADESRIKKLIITHLYPEALDANPLKTISEIFRGPAHLGMDLDTFSLFDS